MYQNNIYLSLSLY